MIKPIIVFSGKFPPPSEGVRQGQFANRPCEFSGNLGDLGYLGHVGLVRDDGEEGKDWQDRCFITQGAAFVKTA
ncbi:MAG: hypothetical protein AB1405_18160 [Bdellovibrionota bacterium]